MWAVVGHVLQSRCLLLRLRLEAAAEPSLGLLKVPTVPSLGPQLAVRPRAAWPPRVDSVSTQCASSKVESQVTSWSRRGSHWASGVIVGRIWPSCDWVQRPQPDRHLRGHLRGHLHEHPAGISVSILQAHVIHEESLRCVTAKEKNGGRWQNPASSGKTLLSGPEPTFLP